MWLIISGYYNILLILNSKICFLYGVIISVSTIRIIFLTNQCIKIMFLMNQVNYFVMNTFNYVDIVLHNCVCKINVNKNVKC